MPITPEAKKQRNAELRTTQRLAVFAAYGGPMCVCCGERELCFLTIDHARNDGGQFRKETGHGSRMFYRWLIKNGFPQDLGLRVLCYNCNCGRQCNEGVCPHEQRGYQKGEHHPTRVRPKRLTVEDIAFIKSHRGRRGPQDPYAPRRLTTQELGKIYGVSYTVIFKIQHDLPTNIT